MESIDEPNHRAFTDEYEALKKERFRPSEKRRISITGAAGCMGSAVCRRLKREGHYVIASDWTKNEHMAEDEFCNEYHVVNPTVMDDCLKVTRGIDSIFHFATSTVGLGFNESSPMMTKDDNTIIGYNMVEAARINGVQRFFHASIAYINPELDQAETNASLNESVACLTKRQYPIGFEKHETEVLCERYHKDFGFECRIGRFYCIYGPFETWKGGRGKAPAAFCREASTSTDTFEMCGDGLQTRIHKYAEDVLRLMESDSREPAYIGSLDLRELVNIRSDEIVSKNEIAEMALSFEDNYLPIHHHIPGAEGIRGRNSDDTLIEEKLGCMEVLKDWLRMTCFWIKEPIEKVKAQGTDSSTDAPVELGSLRTAHGKE